MISIFGVDLELSQNRAELLYLLEDRVKRHKIGYLTDNVIRSLTGQLLTTYAVAKVSGCDPENIVYRLACFGKPELVSPIGWHFNRSHAGDLVVCAVGRKAVGIDVERVRELSQQTIQAVFTSREVMEVANHFADRSEGFCDRWTLKESYLKALGNGVPESMRSFEIINTSRRLCAYSNNVISNNYFRQYPIRDGYRMSVCSLDHVFQNPIEWVALNRLTSNVR